MSLPREVTHTREWEVVRTELERAENECKEQLIAATTEQDSAKIRGRIEMLREILRWEEEQLPTF